MQPVNDSSDIVVHARQALFVMLLVSGVVLTEILFYHPDRLRRAIDEMEIVNSLMALWDKTRSANNSGSLAAVVAGPAVPDEDLYEAYDLRLHALRTSDESEVDELTCRTMLDLNQYFIIPEGLGAVSIHFVKDMTTRESIEILPSLWWSLSPSNSYKPRNLSHFEQVWNVLIEGRRAARITKVYPELGYLSDSYTGSSQYGVKSSQPVDISKPERLQHNLNLFTPVNEETEQALHPDHTYQKGTVAVSSTFLNYWKELGVEGLAKAECVASKEDGGKRFYHLTMPAEWRLRKFDATQIWQERAWNEGFLRRGKYADSIPFIQAFPSLHREARGLETLDLQALQVWLRNRLDESGETIQVIGVSIPHHLIRNIGVILVTIFQIYALLHISQVCARMRNSAEEDPGAFKPWVMLYDGKLAMIVSLSAVVAPCITIAVAVFRLTYDGKLLSFWGVASFLTLIFSGMVATLTLNRYRELRRVVRKHRNST